MKLSAKSRYALAAVINMAMTYESQERVTLLSLSENLNISKIYLEHIFSLLKRGEIVTAMKGAQGGYLLNRSPKNISVYDVLKTVEPSLFAQNVETVQDSAPDIEQALKNGVFLPFDDAIKATLSNIFLSTLVSEAEKHNNNFMYYL